MMHHGPRVAGLLAILAALLLAPSALAATPATGSAAAKAKERAYGKHCGAKSKAAKRAAQRAKCLEAMAKLATGKSSSPSKACAALSKKKARGERKSAYARCVSEGAKLLKAKRRAARNGDAGAGAGHDPAREGDEAGDPPDGGEAVDDFANVPPDEIVPEDFLSADELDPDF